MKTKPLLSKFLLLIVLIAAAIGSYALSRFILDPILPAAPGLPPLSRLRLPPQTQNGITATVESYYADALRLVFVVRVEGEAYYLDSLSLTDSQNEELNTGYSLFSPANDSSTFIIDMQPASPLTETRLNGQLSFTVTSSPEGESPVRFHFDLDLPVHPALTLEPGQSFVALNGSAILLDRLVITPSFTQAYLCYTKPTPADWMIGQTATLRVDNQQAGMQSYALLSDPDYFSGDKGGERDWTSPVPKDRCVKVGFPVGAQDPASITLTIPELEQSMPEVIPADQLASALKALKTRDGIDMEWRAVEGGGTYPEYKNIPEGVTEQEAYRSFLEYLGYIYYENWTFDLQLKPTENDPIKFNTSTYGGPPPIPYPSGEVETVNVEARIQAFDVRPDGRAVALATSQGIALLDWTRREVRVMNEAGNVISLDWSPDGKYLAAGSLAADGDSPQLTVWDAAAWRVIFEPGFFHGAFVLPDALAWSPNGKLLAVSNDSPGAVVLDMATGEIVSTQTGFLISPYNIAWSPDGSRLVATGDLGYGFRRWRVDTDEFVRLYDPRAGGMATHLAWLPDGKRIVSGHTNGAVCFWTASTNRCDGLIQAHRTTLFAIALSSDGDQLATASNIIHIWDTRTGALLASFGLKEGIRYERLGWLDSKTIVSLETDMADGGASILRFWDVETGTILFEVRGAGYIW